MLFFRRSCLVMGAAFLVSLTAGCGAPSVATAPVAELSDSASADALRAYPIEDTLGIGPVYGADLRKAGVTNTAKLLDTTGSRGDRQALAQKAGIPYKRILGWAQQAEMMKINGIGPRQANLLVAAGVQSVNDLARRSPSNLETRLSAANSFTPKFVANTPSLSMIQGWITQAGQKPSTLDNDQ